MVRLGAQLTFGATPAEAGAQLGDVANEGQRCVIATFPTGPRPSPGWGIWFSLASPHVPFPRERGGPGATIVTLLDSWAPAFAGERGERS
jgi:hypothetical protein